ncbi:hypothetical protein QBC40DRAFT_93425 [Triangularia verruculosa]|uniref:Secreted protein n=1 Tax=Triangularia verruculosa TaxID=2587418 RepID=A0AAN6XE49_9PEZI|nr:hypothetical protein QBC40DRAFT_93425 [Triangularia verruculosa]
MFSVAFWYLASFRVTTAVRNHLLQVSRKNPRMLIPSVCPSHRPNSTLARDLRAVYFERYITLSLVADFMFL